MAHTDHDLLPTGGGATSVDQSVVVPFAGVAAAHGGRTALESDLWSPTYAELNATANRLAHALMARHVTPGDRIGILMQHDTPQVAAVLSVLKAGGIFVGLNATDPPARLRDLVRDADPACIIADADCHALAKEIAPRAAMVLAFDHASAAGSSDNPAVTIDPADPACLFYTSGSTGQPKAVVQTHRQRLRSALTFIKEIRCTSSDRVAILGSLSNGQGNTSVLSALLCGATALPFPVITQGVTGLPDWMIERRITIYISSTSIFRNLVKTIASDRKFPLVHGVRLASEPVMSDDFRAFQRHFTKDSVLIHTLSSSESGNIAVSRWPHHATVPEGRLPVGLVKEGHEVRIVDESDIPVPPGEIGEIVIRSRYLAAGYWRNPELTAQRFSDAADGSGERIFRSRDLARVGPDGNLQFMGRKDGMIKIRGNRIDLRAVAEAILALPGIVQADVQAFPRPNNEPVLVGFVVLETAQQSWSIRRARDALRKRLPDAMVPSALLSIDHLPLMPNGKVDREALQNIYMRRHQPAPLQPQTDTETLLAALWAEAFETQDIGRQDDFFERGGDSLIAAVLAARIYEALGVRLNLGTFANHPTLAEFALVIDGMKASRGSGVLQPIPRFTRERHAPMSFAQERIWAFSQLPRLSPTAYTESGAWRIVGPVDVDVLRACINDLVRRHEALRTTFAEIDGQAVQIVHPAREMAIDFVDLVEEATTRDDLASRLSKSEAARVFELTKGPLVRFSIVRLGQEEYWLFNTHHHIISDGLSWRLFAEELALLYQARTRSLQSLLTEHESLQYRDYAAWQRQTHAIGSQANDEAVSWWMSQLARGPGTTEMPFRRKMWLPGVDLSKGRMAWTIDPETLDLLDELARAESTTFFLLGLTALGALLAMEVGSPSVIVGAYRTGRRRAELQNMFGDFSNLMMLKIQCESDMTFRESLARNRNMLNEASAYAELPYEMLCRQLRERGVEPPKIRAIFHQAADSRDLRFAGLRMSRVKRVGSSMPWGFTLEVSRDREALACSAHFDARRHNPAKVHAFVGRYQALLDRAARDPDRTVGDLLALDRRPGWIDRLRLGLRGPRRSR
jgi:amino acid adenylation domain-containing protein